MGVLHTNFSFLPLIYNLSHCLCMFYIHTWHTSSFILYAHILVEIATLIMLLCVPTLMTLSLVLNSSMWILFRHKHHAKYMRLAIEFLLLIL